MKYAISLLGMAILIFGLYKDAEKITACGTIKYKIDTTRYHKHYAYADPVFVVVFEKKTMEIHPNWDDYMSRKVGDRVCYKIRKNKGMIYFLVIACGALILVWMGLTSLFTLDELSTVK
jgi:hypothetical protein